ncbi:hypothetical protein L6452_26190 [Arctium lappa]|uniref:Uncharacterized protein n=1 Tax=Arctium lappa TaxID=4217 RepID=A0ACB9ABE6_ARCLA|nr:hypothetical protein L6452_26190 [Arctium lappa]
MFIPLPFYNPPTYITLKHGFSLKGSYSHFYLLFLPHLKKNHQLFIQFLQISDSYIQLFMISFTSEHDLNNLMI